MAEAPLKDLRDTILNVAGFFGEGDQSTYARLMKAYAMRQLSLKSLTKTKLSPVINVAKLEHDLATTGRKLDGLSDDIRRNITRNVSDSNLNLLALDSNRNTQSQASNFKAPLDSLKIKKDDLEKQTSGLKNDLNQIQRNLHGQYDEIGQQIQNYERNRNQVDVKLKVEQENLNKIKKELPKTEKSIENTTKEVQALKQRTDVVVATAGLQHVVAAKVVEEKAPEQKR